ncbi:MULTISPECIES: hypothetical protein [Nosocomiicoccus]|uniref:DUF1307 domain-containing protein n=1 Tax=Nosocomiicoccus massiliensis TaxID=1232430 RepID=A0AAF0YGI7_9STAP|nr:MULTISPECIES: hypothetical protein [Nosocomiicoccus]MDK6863918.1 hypothetical protein [Nosocomiicoccus ampullae]OFO56119.1 hypothetical protein HMPREF3029_02855 [Nosocomiicoccus sp. HMSC059G07]WOS95458.1 hypothetical protein CJ229_004970 [Nosocomiicoccus massiliensis]
MKAKLLFLSAAIVMLTACQSPTDDKVEDTSAKKDEKTEETTQENTSKENETKKDNAKENTSNQTDTLQKDATKGEVTTEHYSNVVDGIEVDIEITADKENDILLTLHQVEKIPYEYYDLKNEEEANQLVDQENAYHDQLLSDLPDDVAKVTAENLPDEKALKYDKFYNYSDPENVQTFIAYDIVEGNGTEETVSYESFIESLKELGVIEDDSASNSNIDKKALDEKVLLVADKKDVEKYDKYYYEASNDVEDFYKMYVVDTEKDQILYEVQMSEVAYKDINVENKKDAEQLIEEKSKEFEKALNGVPKDIASVEIVNDEESEMIKVFHIVNYDSPENVKALADANVVTAGYNGTDFVSHSQTVETLSKSGGLKEVK